MEFSKKILGLKIFFLEGASMMRVLITGAGGFVGRALCAHAAVHGLAVRGVSRSPIEFQDGIESVLIADINASTEWIRTVADCDAIIHLAARVHVMSQKDSCAVDEFHRVNVAATLNLARQAADSGVRRFIFLSSIGVHGAQSFISPFSADGTVSPHSPYALSKFEAEVGLRSIASQSKMEVVIIRSPLIYGANAPGNFGLLMRLISRGVPLPLGLIRNRRSFVGLGNLLDLIVCCLTHPAAANETFLVSDDEDVSTTEFLRRMGVAMGIRVRLVPLPERWLRIAASFLGRSDIVDRLSGSLQVDISKTRSLLGWNPPFTLDQGLEMAAKGDRP